VPDVEAARRFYGETLGLRTSVPLKGVLLALHPAVRDPRLRLTRDQATTSVAGSQTRFHRLQNLRSASFDAHSCSLRWKWSTRPCATSTLGNGAPVFTGDLLPSNHAAYSLDPFALWTAFPSSSVGRDSPDYYGSSATPRRPQRTVRLPQTRGSGGHRRDASHVHHQPVGRVGVQLYPGGIAAQYRNTPHGLARPNRKRAGETVPNSNQDRAPQQPIAASFGADHKYRGFHHWFGLPTPFCLASAPGPLAADRRSIVRGRSHPPPHLRHQAAPQLHPTVTAAEGEASHPARSYGGSWRTAEFVDEQEPTRPSRIRRGSTADVRTPSSSKTGASV
jgi:hypothetical protein